MKNVSVLTLHAVCLLALAACGGGGGSPPGDPNQVQMPATFQGANTTKTYPVSSAAANFNVFTGVTSSGIDASGSGSTITVTTDANDRISSLNISISTGGVTFNQTYAGSSLKSLSGPITLGQLASYLEQIGNVSGTNGFLLQGSNQSLNYSAFGGWLANDGGGYARIGVAAGGVETTTMPTSGSATYNGTTMGVGSNGTASFALTGNAQVVANFSTGSVTTTFSGLTTQDLNTNAIGSLATQTGSGTITGNKYSTSISGGGLSGTANGTFYGPTANETAGVWKVSGGSINAMGSFGAHQ